MNTYFYTNNNLEYISERFGLENESYVNETNEYKFYAPILHNNLGKVESANLSYLPIPNVEGEISDKVLKKEMHVYFEKINQLGWKRIALRQDPLIKYNNQIIKSILQEGFVPNVFFTTIVDLTLPQEKLWQNIRKSYKALINGLEKNNTYKLITVDSKNNLFGIDDWIEMYMTLIRRGGGTPTRERFKNIETSLKDNLAKLYLLYQDKKLISGICINYNNNLAYYSASGTHPDFEGKDYYSHLLLWEAIKDLKQKGFSTLEIGPVFYNNVKNFYNPSEKELSISDFKLGMGGTLTPFFIYEKLKSA